MPLVTSKPKDALGQPIDAATIYTPVMPFAADLGGVPGVWNPGKTRLRGDHAAVQAFAGHFVPDGVDSATIDRLRAARLYPSAPNER